MIPEPLEHLIKEMSKLPGLGKRSAQRAALHLLTDGEKMFKIQQALIDVAQHIKTCQTCGNIGLADPCHICTSDKRDKTQICVVEGVDDLWAMERADYNGLYHVLGGVVSAIDGIGPDDIRMPALFKRVEKGEISEVILALGASIDGQTTSHLIAQRLKAMDVNVSMLAKGIPVGAEVDYLDEGTLAMALRGRHQF